MASPPAEVHRVVGARRVPCGGENTAKQPHAGVSIALNSAPVKPEATLGRSYGVRTVFSSAPRMAANTRSKLLTQLSTNESGSVFPAG